MNRRTGCALLLAIEALCLGLAGATTITVTTLSDADDTDGECSLREAIAAANGDAPYQECAAGDGGADRIVFGVTGVIALLSALPALTDGVAISGPGRDLLAVDGQDQWLPFVLVGPAWSLIEALTVRRGLGVFGGCISSTSPLVLRDLRIRDCRSSTLGGGVSLDGALWMERIQVDGNATAGSSGGGGIYVQTGPVTVVDSTIADNHATDPSGVAGGLRLQGVDSARISNSTISGNSAGGAGGGILVTLSGSDGSLSVQSSTITANTASSDGSSLYGGGGVAWVAAPGHSLDLEVVNSVIAGNFDGDPTPGRSDLGGDGAVDLTASGFDLIGDNGVVEALFPAGLPNLNGDFVGTTAAPLDPQLEALADHGGPTPTHAPLPPASPGDPHPVIDQGGCPAELRDQRGRGNPATGLRAVDTASPDNPDGDGCDIGAYEAGASPLPYPTVFVDGFETGSTLLWSDAVP